MWDVGGSWYFVGILHSLFKMIFHMLCVCPNTPQQAWQGGWGCPLDKWENRHRMWVPSQGHLQSPEEISPAGLEMSHPGVLLPGWNHKGRKAWIYCRQYGKFLRRLRNSNSPPEGPYSSGVSLLCSPKPFRRYGIWFGVRERVLKAFGINRGETKDMKRGKMYSG